MNGLVSRPHSAWMCTNHVLSIVRFVFSCLVLIPTSWTPVKVCTVLQLPLWHLKLFSSRTLEPHRGGSDAGSICIAGPLRKEWACFTTLSLYLCYQVLSWENRPPVELCVVAQRTRHFYTIGYCLQVQHETILSVHRRSCTSSDLSKSLSLLLFLTALLQYL